MSNFSGEIHSFDVALAAKYGVEEAIVLHHFQFWVKFNKRTGKNYREGRTWTFNTQKDLIAHFPYFKNRYKVIRIVENLVEKKVLKKGNFNKTTFDRTVWYAFENESDWLTGTVEDPALCENEQCIVQNRTMECSKTHNGECENAPPIPDTKTEYETNRKKGGKKDLSPPPPLSFGKHVKISTEEHTSLVQTFTEPIVCKAFEEINDYLSSSGKKPYKDFAAATRNWIRRSNNFKPKNSHPPNSYQIPEQAQTNIALYESVINDLPYKESLVKRFGNKYLVEVSSGKEMYFDRNPVEFKNFICRALDVTDALG